MPLLLTGMLLLGNISVQAVTLEATAYAPLEGVAGGCHDGNPHGPATGSTPRHGTIAVNPAIIPYGSAIYVPGYGWGIAADTGGMIRRRTNLIDLWMSTRREALLWGRRRVQAYIATPRRDIR